MKRAAGMVIFRDGKIVAIKSPKNKGWNLPFGKCEPGKPGEYDEHPQDAAIRECLEETGIEVFECDLLYDAQDINGFHAFTYVAREWAGEPRGSEEGEAAWVDLKEICAFGTTYEGYNRSVAKRVCWREGLETDEIMWSDGLDVEAAEGR